ncbi:MAG: SoxR reducing system RseC family protein [Dehalococcoidia bacterium]|nr:SoxR reducing system RseC family protein [Dehalococcoidia bacterium]
MPDTDRSDRVAMWQTYVQTAENTSIRREAINRYMVPVHLAILAGHLALPLTEPYHFLVGVAGMGVSYLWLALLDAHSKINKVKYDIILAMEKDLPSQPFNDEAEDSGIDKGGRRIYPPLTRMQYVAARAVFITHTLIAVVYLVLWWIR